MTPLAYHRPHGYKRCICSPIGAARGRDSPGCGQLDGCRARLVVGCRRVRSPGRLEAVGVPVLRGVVVVAGRPRHPRRTRESARRAGIGTVPGDRCGDGHGQVSYSKVRAITRIATPECEQALVDMALAGTTNHVERIVSAYRRAEPIAVEREQIQHTRRGLFHNIEVDGSVVITVRLPAEAAATVLSAIEHLVAPSVAEPDGTRDPVSARRADALVDLAIAGNAASGRARLGNSLPRPSARQPISLERWRRPLRDPRPRRQLGPTNRDLHRHRTADVVRCRHRHRASPHEDGITKHLERRNGLVRGKRRREVEQRDEHRCQVPGCARRGKLEVHHIKHRARKGDSNLPNLTLLCRFHHHRLHEGGWTAVRTPDGLELHDSHGRRICSRPPITTGDGTAVAAQERKPADGRCKWTGERFDLGYALDALFSRTHTPQGVPKR